PIESRGLRSTRATARHLEISDGGTSNVSEPESLRKTHLTRGGVANHHPAASVYRSSQISSKSEGCAMAQIRIAGSCTLFTGGNLRIEGDSIGTSNSKPQEFV